LVVGLGVALPIGQYLMRGLVLVADTERAKTPRRHRLHFRSHRPFRPVRGNDHPAPHDRILAQFRHRQTPEVRGKPLQIEVHDSAQGMREEGGGMKQNRLLSSLSPHPSSLFYTSHMICSKSRDGRARAMTPSRGARSQLWPAWNSSTW